MSNSSDDPRYDPRQGRPGGPTQRPPAVRPFSNRQDIAPPPPRARALDWDDNNDPLSAPPARRVDDGGRGFALEFEPSPLRHGRAPQRDIEPPVDDGYQDSGRHQGGHLHDAYHQVMTQPPPEAIQRQASTEAARDVTRAPARPAAPSPRIDDDLVAPARGEKVEKGRGLTPIVEAGTVTGKSLTLVIVIMSFLACLTAGAVYLINQSANAWLRDIAAEVTVQVEARDKAGIDRLMAGVDQFLRKQPGVRAVKPLSSAENAQLLEPWLGQSDILKDLPVPRLIAIEVDRVNPPNFDQLRAALVEEFKGVTLDDHRHWQRQIRTVTRSFALGGLAILMLVGAATTAIIVSATRRALAANREIVEVLHFVGATDKFIAREFAGHFLSLGIRAGIVGAGAAMLVFFLLPFGMEMIGGGAVTMAELRRLIGAGTLDWPGYLILLVVVAVIAALCMLTSRIGVYRILNSQH